MHVRRVQIRLSNFACKLHVQHYTFSLTLRSICFFFFSFLYFVTFFSRVICRTFVLQNIGL